jgi:hypothetical protein
MTRILLSLALVALAAPLHADVFHLASGGQVVGDLVNADESPRTSYKIRTGQGIVVTFERAQVAEHETTRPALEEYERIKPTYADTVEGQMALADWCSEHSMYTERETHLRRVIELDTDHAQARAGLGYVKVEGGWMTREQMMAARGYVRRGSRYYLPQQIAMMAEREKAEKAEKEWYVKIRMWRGWLDDPRRFVEGQARLEAIDDPLALAALKKSLNEEPNPEVRLLYLKPLNRMNSIASNELLVDRLLNDPFREVRLQALDYVAEDPKPEVPASLIRALQSKQNDVINRAAYALAHLKTAASVGPLIDVLVTKHKFKVTYGNPGGMSTTFGGSSNGGGISGFSAGGTTKEVTEHRANAYVLDALIALTGQNYGYNTAAWKAWFNQQNAPESLNTRRD